MSKHYIIVVLSTIVLAAIFSLTQGTLNFFLHFTNTIFYIGLTLFVIGGFLLIVQSGFFNITRFGMRKVFGTRDQQMAEMTGDESLTVKKDMIYRRYRFSITKPLLMASITLVILSFLFSFIIIY
ncbi:MULTISPECIES: DUF3899 domain-containing protein [Bacillaceae]|jgi:hypothetical protein|uniref:DUF3899 domain-containing protein n=1 Tax=Bacillaceae TaxID=186817 RepID=UPI0008EEEF32|nr:MULTISPECIES: DUF3899 domain-containing protein [Bacillaceae]SFD42482.1 protein of unknown function [Bacillus sp. UNCCL81]